MARFLVLYGLTLSTSGVLATASAQPPQRPLAARVDRQSVALHPGLRYTQLTGQAGAAESPWSAHVLQVDLARHRIEIAMAVDQVIGQEAPSSMVERKGAAAGVNGGFSVSNDPMFLTHGDPNGFVVIDGDVVSEPVAGRPALGFCGTSGRQQVRVFEPVMRIEGLPHVAREWGLNRALSGNDAVLYTPIWGRTTLSRAGTVEVVVRAGRVERVATEGSSVIPANGFVLAASGTAAGALRSAPSVGDSLAYAVRLTGGSGEPIDVSGCDFTSAGPLIASGGVVRGGFDPAAYRPSFVVDRHPRTAVGLSADGATLYLLVIDGRQPDLSAGATLEELARLLIGEGAAEVYNLDGGGSSAMALAGRGVVNKSSDGSERRRSDVVLVIPIR